ncbi:MAG TPA: flagellar FliJ family protein [Phycisphaerae bacterium]|nr:flagellar FliJ family protein [Phycisphaerae bacterium]
MKRLRWPLQRFLDVTLQREKARRAELLGITRRIARLRQEVLVRRTGVRGMILEMAAMDFQERLWRHPEFVACSQAQEREIGRLEAQLAELTDRRTEKTRALLETRRRRETLDRLRAEAWAEHLREQGKAEQKQLDEIAHVGKARELIEARWDAE